jgi:two-component system, OmpR family, phosphate regulon response regulator OmpR
MVLKVDMPHILVVDDDDRIRRLLAQYLTKNGYIVVTAENAMDARAIIKKYEFDLCVLDVMMPGESGLELSKYITLSHDMPILLLTAMSESNDRIAGLETGADDYLPKPFEPKELLLRIQAILRRSNKPKKQTIVTDSILHLDGGRIYRTGQKTIQIKDGTDISLTEGDRAILHALAQKPNIPVRREMLAAQLDLESNDRAVDVQITRLRKKIEPEPANPSIIVTLRGKGYMLQVIEASS